MVSEEIALKMVIIVTTPDDRTKEAQVGGCSCRLAGRHHSDAAQG